MNITRGDVDEFIVRFDRAFAAVCESALHGAKA